MVEQVLVVEVDVGGVGGDTAAGHAVKDVEGVVEGMVAVE